MPGIIFALHLDGNGAPLGSIVQVTKPVTDLGYLGFYPAVASDGGRNFLLAWREITSGNAERISAQYLGPMCSNGRKMGGIDLPLLSRRKSAAN